jgi:small-conductance mechanosensitive channel
MDEPLSPPAILQKLFQWGEAHIWNMNTLFELLLIILCFVAGSVFSGMVHERVTKAIDASSLPLRTKRLARISRRLIFPALSLIIMSVTAQIVSADWVGMEVSLMAAVTKVLLAWIVIRLSLQIVENAIIRNVFSWAIWLVAALSIFGFLDQTTSTLESYGFTLGEFRISALEIIKSALLLGILLYIAIFISAFFERKVLKSKNMSRSSQVLISKIIRLSLIIVSIVIGIASAGIDLSIFAVFSGAIGLGIGLGLQRSASNLLSGLMLLMDQSIKPGDVIELDKDGTYGVINEMAARYIEVVTRDNKSYLIPNEEFVNQRVVNWSHGNNLVRLELFFGVHYKSDPHKVIQVALEAARKTSARISTDPEPLCYLREFGDSALNFTLRFWISDAEHGVGNIKGEVLLALWDAFKANGLEIPYPQREIFIRSETANKI